MTGSEVLPDDGERRPLSGRALADSTWPELAGGALLVVPLGATEQHGPHLPLDTDTAIAAELAALLVGERPDAVLAPALPYGASGEHQGLPGTLSLGAEVMESLVVELVRSADDFAGTVLVGGHGGNAGAVGRALRLLGTESRPVMAWSPTAAVLAAAVPEMTARLEGDHHAGLVETSMMLALRPGCVRPVDAATPRVVAPLAQLMPRLVRDGVVGVSPTGVLGDPAGASAELGRRWLAALGADLARRVDEWVERTGLGAGIPAR